MSIILTYLFQISKNAYALFSGASIFLCCYFLNRNSKLKEDNKTLITGMEEMNIETKKIVTIQAKQMDMASRPPVSRDNILRWMRSGKDSPE
jgi:hypothetical protein